MKLIHVPPASLRPLPYNPASRLDEDALAALEADIAANGVLMPLVATGDNELIDGHRRREAAIRLKLPSVPVLITALDCDEGFRRLNDSATRKPLKGRDWLCVYASGGFPPEPYLGQCNELEAIVGVAKIRWLVERRCALHVLSVARQVARHIGDEHRAFLKKLILWMVEHKMQLMARRAVQQGVPADIILDAVQRNRPIRWTATVA